MLDKIKKSLAELGFKENEINVYIALTELGESVASKIAKKVGLPRTTAISILDKLEFEKLITVHKQHGTKQYWVESPKMIMKSFESKIQIAKDLDSLLSDLYRTESDFPYAKIFDTKQGIKNFIEKTLLGLKKKTTIYTIDTPNIGNYKKIYTDEFYKALLDVKIKKQIQTKTLVPSGETSDIDPEKLKVQSIEIREMPSQVIFKSSLWIIDDMIVHFSGKYPFIVAINHKLIAGSMKSVYDLVWNLSK